MIKKRRIEREDIIYFNNRYVYFKNRGKIKRGIRITGTTHCKTGRRESSGPMFIYPEVKIIKKISRDANPELIRIMKIFGIGAFG